MMGRDNNCAEWLKAERAASVEGPGDAAAARAARREQRRTKGAP
jgi:hypothetical protein